MKKQARKDAILNVLAAHLSDSEFQRYSKVWKSDYADQPQYGMVPFLNLLYSEVKMPLSKGDLVKEFNGALHQLRRPAGGKPQASITERQAFNRIFEIMYFEITKELEDNQNNLLSDQQFEHLKGDGKVKGKSAQQLHAWMKSRRGDIDLIEIDDEILKSVFSKAYFFCCESFGPSKADIFLSRALDKASASKYSKLVAPTSIISI